MGSDMTRHAGGLFKNINRLNANMEANWRIRRWGSDLRVQRIVHEMPWWRRRLFRLGEVLGNDNVEPDYRYLNGKRINGGRYGLLMRPAVRWIERQR